MSGQEYNIIRSTPVVELCNIPARQLIEFLKQCRPLVSEAILIARLSR
ncbi:Unknown protein sequence [Pseudomonas savastanoi pv. glycinea]|uniref:Uncharacterized protein n=1 Tax=Pseudomonas savastanoi pv. glycinea TaxID=318 RepID=A0ABR5LFS0_PSESG|nr:hypothetical protein [Pseudomonas savastanoi]KPC36341.1 Unknown protein sequence [Pseudomonas savastanoi pv. glycinea]KPC45991.1 Unknown protein sequence [Pseudomonas savastanoi pv. glycinea]